MCQMIKRIKQCLLITFIMTAIKACSSSQSSQTFTVVEFGPGAEKMFTNFPLSPPFESGMVLHVVASTTDLSRFDIKDNKNNIVFRVEPRYHGKIIVHNTHIGGWGPEENVNKMFFKSGVKYNLHISHEFSGYRTFINGEELLFYKLRSQTPGVIFEMNNEGKSYYITHKLNEPKWAVRQPNNGMYIREFSDEGIQSPYEIQLQGSYPLSSIVITGIINTFASSIDFNLTNSADEEIFYFSIRFTENCVVRNSRLEGVWGTEERNGGMPFKINERLTLAIDVDVDYYKVYVDGAEFFTYKHRTSYYNVNKLKISAGIKIFKTIYQK